MMRSSRAPIVLAFCIAAPAVLAASRWDDATSRGWDAFASARYEDAERAWREALDAAADMAVSDPRRASSDLHVALALKAQGKLGDAELHARRALDRVKGSGLEGTAEEARVLVALGGVLRLACRFPEAESRLARSVEISERLHPDHPDTATAVAELAALLRAMGRLSEAVVRYERVLAIREETLPAVHPDVARALSNLALCYRDQGRSADATTALERAIVVWERAVGRYHTDVASGLNNLGLVLKSQGDLRGAARCFTRAIEIWSRNLGNGHPDVAAGLSNLAAVHRAAGDYDDAESAHMEAIAIRRHALGSDHPDVARSLTNLAFLYGMERRMGEAERVFGEALSIWEAGADGCEAARGMELYASVLRHNGMEAEALEFETRARGLREPTGEPADVP